MDKFVVGTIIAMGLLISLVLAMTAFSPEDDMIQVENTGFWIKYEITNADLLEIKKDNIPSTIIVLIDTRGDGKLVITGHDALFDPMRDNKDAILFVLVDGEEVEFTESKSLLSRTLSIPFVKGNQEIEILRVF